MPDEKQLTVFMAFSTRQVLVTLAVVGSCAGVAFLFVATPSHFNPALECLLAGLVSGACVYMYQYGYSEPDNVIEWQVTKGAVLTLSLGVGLVSFLLIWENIIYRRIAVVVFGAGAAYFLLTKRKKSSDTMACAPPRFDMPAEPPPKQAPAVGNQKSAEPDWEAAANRLETLGQNQRQLELHVLRRIYAASTTNSREPAEERLQKVQWTIEQEATRLLQRAEMEDRADEDDVLSKVTNLVQWATQKVPELAELDMSDVIMAKTVADINQLRSSISTAVVDLSELKAIHNVDRETAVEKSKQRALAARNALPLLKANGMVLGEALIAANEELQPFESITGIQVVSLGDQDGYVTFEGNGRAWALKQAFGPEYGVKVEVRLFLFEDVENARKIVRRVKRVREWKKVTDEWPEQI